MSQEPFSIQADKIDSTKNKGYQWRANLIWSIRQIVLALVDLPICAYRHIVLCSDSIRSVTHDQ
jgi:hypothetical protein